MRTRVCLGWLGVLIMGVTTASPVLAADKQGAPAAAGASTTGRAANPDDDLDDLDADIPVPPPPAPAAPAPRATSTPSPMQVSSEAPPLEPRPDRYTIQRGDTLWEISQRFWGDAFFWPRLWSYNPYIGNAHLIYPGNVLRFDPGSYGG